MVYISPNLHTSFNQKNYFDYSLERENENPKNHELQIISIIETYTDELMFTNIGRRSLKVSKIINS